MRSSRLMGMMRSHSIKLTLIGFIYFITKIKLILYIAFLKQLYLIAIKLG